MNEKTETQPGASMKALESAAMSRLTEMLAKDTSTKKPSPEAVRIAAHLIARKAHEAQGKGMDSGEAPE